MPRPPGPRPPSERDLETPKIRQSSRQQLDPIFQQRMGGGAGQSGGTQQGPLDLTGSAESSSKEVTSN